MFESCPVRWNFVCISAELVKNGYNIHTNLVQSEKIISVQKLRRQYSLHTVHVSNFMPFELLHVKEVLLLVVSLGKLCQDKK